MALLPPIIFNSGYHIKNELFVRHIIPIFLYSCLGTAISTFVVAGILQFALKNGFNTDFDPSFAELLTFGALISATDPVSTLAIFEKAKVDPQLFYLVFGKLLYAALSNPVGVKTLTYHVHIM